MLRQISYNTNMNLQLIRTHKEAGNATSFVFQPEKPLTWQAGQFMHYSLPKPVGSKDDMKRFFTISSPPHTGTPQITTRITESDFKQALNSLRVGDSIEATDPEGDFVWQDSAKPVVFVAGGIGVTPFHSILLDRAQKGMPLSVTLLYANRDDQIVFKEELEALAKNHSELKIIYIIGKPLTATTIIEAIPNAYGSLIYLSGAEPMVETIGDELKAKMPEDQLKQDFFPGYTAQTF